MILEIRRKIALYIGTCLMLFSFGLLKPNTSGLPTAEDSIDPAGNSTIGLNMEEDSHDSFKP